MLLINKDALFSAVARFVPIVKSIEITHRFPAVLVVGLIEDSLSVTFISASAAYNCSNFCSMLTME